MGRSKRVGVLKSSIFHPISQIKQDLKPLWNKVLEEKIKRIKQNIKNRIFQSKIYDLGYDIKIVALKRTYKTGDIVYHPRLKELRMYFYTTAKGKAYLQPYIVLMKF